MKNPKTINTNLIDQFLIENKLSKYAFCKLCKITPLTLRKIYSGNDNINIVYIYRIAKILNTEIYKLFETN